MVSYYLNKLQPGSRGHLCTDYLFATILKEGRDKPVRGTNRPRPRPDKIKVQRLVERCAPLCAIFVVSGFVIIAVCVIYSFPN